MSLNSVEEVDLDGKKCVGGGRETGVKQGAVLAIGGERSAIAVNPRGTQRPTEGEGFRGERVGMFCRSAISSRKPEA